MKDAKKITVEVPPEAMQTIGMICERKRQTEAECVEDLLKLGASVVVLGLELEIALAILMAE